ncbi:MAG: hypothetical protein EOP04_30700, partial [Proteobacteria bacterium]
MKSAKRTGQKIKQTISKFAFTVPEKKKRRRIFSIQGILPVFPTRSELREEFMAWSELDPIRLDEL